MSRSENEEPRESAPDREVRRRALLVGIRTYPEIPGRFGQPLAGCHNDVAHLRRALLGRGFDDRDLEVLIDPVEGCDCPFCSEEAERPDGLPTRDGIVAALERLHDATAPGDVVVFFYSGHGSEISGRGLYAGRRFQSFVPHDSGRGGAENRDVSDREIESWIRRMGARTRHLTLIFDCCHSGGVTDLRSEAAAVRRVDADEREDAAAYARGLRRELERELPIRGDERRSAIVLSACAAKELSSETEVEGRRQGLFTDHLTRILARPPVAGETWADLFPEIAMGVMDENLAQNPRRGGNGPVFEPGPIDSDDVDPPDVIELARLAVVIGIDYQAEDEAGDASEEGRPGRFPPLLTPRRDAEEVARVLTEEQGYEIVGVSDRHPGPLLGKKATRRRIHKVLHRLAAVKARTRRETAVMVYFAGHGVVRTTEDGEHRGHLVPSDADPDDPSTWLAMQDLRDQLVDGIRDPKRLELMEQRGSLSRLASRHLLLVLDCCFGGAMAYDFFRGGDAGERPIYYSEYKRFVEGTAWQLLTSASFNQQALDRDPRDPEQPYSPFAQAFIEGLSSGAADARGTGRGDHIVTAAELHQHIDRRLKGMGVDVQTPGLVDLRPRDGQYIFSVPGFAPTPLPDPPLDPAANPWRGGRPYLESEDGGAELYCGREQAVLDLLAGFLACRRPSSGDVEDNEDVATSRRPALAVAGFSGSGVTSLLRAGLLTLLADPVAARRRLRSWLRREGRDHLLAAREDLRALRRWVDELDLREKLAPDAGDGADEWLAARIRAWAIEAGWLDKRGEAGAGPSRILRESLGVPSFDRMVRDDRELGWLRRLDPLSLLDRPALLADRLRLWSERQGLADFFSVPDRALAALVGRWQVTISPPESIEPAGDTDRGTLWLCDPLSAAAGAIEADDWLSLLARPDLQIVAAVRADALTRDVAVAALFEQRAADGWSRWRLHRLEPPTRDELWRVIQEPAASRVLFFEPEAMVEALVDEAAGAPAPLAILSLALTHMVERAWHRRGAADRQLIPGDLLSGEPDAGTPDEVPGAPIASLLARKSEALYRSLGDPSLRRTFRTLVLRAVSLEDGRAVPRPVYWNELEIAAPDERRRLDDQVLPALIDKRLMVAGERRLELASGGLLAAWPRARRWLRFLTYAGARPQALWRRALEWERSGFDPGKLWIGESGLPRLLTARTLNRLEWAFVAASEVARRAAATEALGVQALRGLEIDWSRSALVAVELLARARDVMALIERMSAVPEGAPPEARASLRRLARDARSRGRQLAEQTLRDVLAATPLSHALPVSGEVEGRIEGLAFDDQGRVSARVGSTRLSWLTAEPGAMPDREAGVERPAVGEGEVRPRRLLVIGPLEPFPPVPPRRPPHSPRGPHAQTGHDRSIRYFGPGQLLSPPRLRRPPLRLLGHCGIPSFLAFSPPEKGKRTPRWLASAADAGGRAELRLWPIDEEGDLACEPSVTFVSRRDRAREALGLGPRTGRAGGREGDGTARIRRLDHLPVTLTAGGRSWRLKSVAVDGSRLRLRPPDAAAARWLEIPSDPAAPGAVSGLREIRLGPEGEWLAVITRWGWAGLWSLPDLTLRWQSADRVATLTWSPPMERVPAGDRLAVGHLDGRVVLHWWTPAEKTAASEPAASVLLRADRDGFAVRDLRFEPGGRSLTVERQSVYEPFDRSLAVYRLDVGELADLARRHAGRDLRPEDLSPASLGAAFGSGPAALLRAHRENP